MFRGKKLAPVKACAKSGLKVSGPSPQSEYSITTYGVLRISYYIINPQGYILYAVLRNLSRFKSLFTSVELQLIRRSTPYMRRACAYYLRIILLQVHAVQFVI